MLRNGIRYLILTLIIVTVTFLGILQIPQFRNYAITYITEKIEEKTGSQIVVDDISLLLPFEIKLHGIQAKIPKYGSISVKHAIFRLNPFTLFKSELLIHSVALEDVSIQVSKEENQAISTRSSPNIPSIPYNLTLSQLRIDKLTINHPIGPIDADCPIDLTASLKLQAKRNQAFVKASLSPHLQPESALKVSLAYDRHDGFIDIDLDIDQQPHGFFTPSGISHYHAAFEFSATEPEWLAWLNNPASTINGRFDAQATLENDPNKLISLKSRLTVSRQTEVQLDTLSIDYGDFSTQGHASLKQNDQLFNAYLYLENDSLKTVMPYAIINKARFYIQVNGKPSNWQIEASAASDFLSINNLDIESIDTRLKGQYNEDTFQGLLSSSFSIDGSSERSSCKVDWKLGDTLAFEALAVNLPSSQINGNLLYHFKRSELTGELTGKSDNLRPLTALLFNRDPLNGSLSFHLEFLENEKIKINGKSEHLSTAATAMTNSSFFAEIEKTCSSAPEGKITFDAEVVEVYGITLEALSFLTESTEEKAWRFILTEDAAGSELNINGQWSYRDSILDMTADPFTGKWHHYAVKSEKPIILNQSESRFTLSVPALAVDNGFISAQLLLKPEAINLQAIIEDFPLEIINFKLYGESLAGTINAELALDGTIENFTGQGTLTFQDLIIPEGVVIDMPMLSGKLATRVTHNALYVDGVINAEGKSPVDIQAKLPTTLSLKAPFFEFDVNGPLDVDMKAQGPIAPFIDLFFADTFSFVGSSDINVHIEGSLIKPDIQGEWIFSHGRFESYELGTIIDNIEGRVAFDGDQARLLRLQGDDRFGGTVSGEGRVSFSPVDKYPFALKLELDKILAINLDALQANLAGELLIKGDATAATLSGRVASGAVNISVPSRGSFVVESVPVSYVNQPESRTPPTLIKNQTSFSYPLSLDLTLLINDNLTVSDEDVNSLWGGEIHFEGPISDISSHGALRLQKGMYTLNGTKWDLSEGTITFNGDIEDKTTLFIVASRDIQDIRVDIILKGGIQDPKIALRSTPPLPQQGILSLILFGTAPTEITPSQDEVLEKSLEDLKRGYKGPGALSKIQKQLFIDRIDISRNRRGRGEETSVRVGKYLTDNLYFSFNKGIGDDEGSVSLEAKITDNVKLEVEGGYENAGQVSLIWKHDY